MKLNVASLGACAAKCVQQRREMIDVLTCVQLDVSADVIRAIGTAKGDDVLVSLSQHDRAGASASAAKMVPVLILATEAERTGSNDAPAGRR